jgi:hypothetical protein
MKTDKKTKAEKQKIIPANNILNNDFIYVPSAKTDVTQTWKKYGWKPIENRELFYANK